MKSTYYRRAGTASRSYNATAAEAAGRMPATRAAKAWGFRSAAALRACVPSREWHHVSKYANCVDYYDVAAWIDDMSDINELAGVAPHLNRAGRERVLKFAVKSIVSKHLQPPTVNRSRHKSRGARQIGDQYGIHLKDTALAISPMPTFAHVDE